eukprot:COSAG02_NODE_191_length_30004_cov_86.740980_4_plen_585_part_00
MSRLHAFLSSMQELHSLQAAEAEALARPIGPAGSWPTTDGVIATGATQRGEPWNGAAIAGMSAAWVDPAMPPEAAQLDALDCVRTLRERQQQQATDALLRDASLRTLHGRLQAQKLQVDLEGIHQSRHATFRLGNEYMRQSARQNAAPGGSQSTMQTAAAVARISPLGYGKQFESGMSAPSVPLPSSERAMVTSSSHGSGHLVDSTCGESAVAPDQVGAQEVVARCAEEFGRCENSAVDMDHYLLVWQAYTSWTMGMYDYGRGFEIPCLGRIVVKNQRFGGAHSNSNKSSSNVQRKQVAEFFGSHRTLGRHGLTQRVAAVPAGEFYAAYHRASRVNYAALQQHCGLHVEDIIRRLKEFVWCMLQKAGEHPEKHLQIDLGPCVLSCKHRRLSVQFRRPPGSMAHVLYGQSHSPPASPPLTPRGDQSPSVLSVVSDASSWTVQSIGSSVVANGRWARWPLLLHAQFDDDGDDIERHDSRDTRTASTDDDTAHITQLNVANAALGAENALLRAKLDRLLHFTTTELQHSGAVDMTAPPTKPSTPPLPPPAPRHRQFAARCRTLAVPVAPPVRHCGGKDVVGSNYPAW